MAILNKLKQLISVICNGKRQECCEYATSVNFGKTASIVNSSGKKELIKIDSGTIINGNLQTYYGKGKIKIGKSCYVGPNTYIWSFIEITIGDHVLIAHNCNIFDSNCHPLDAEERRVDYKDLMNTGLGNQRNTVEHSPIIIGDDCWIGANSCIMKGVVLGERSIVAAGSVVTKSFPADVLIGGNPAKVIRKLKE